MYDFDNCLNGKTVFNTLDNVRATDHIPMAKEGTLKTAVSTAFRILEFAVSPFGLTNATQAFQRFMNTIIRNLDFVYCYIDDIVIMSEPQEQHREHLCIVLSRLQHGLSISASKCSFGQGEVQCLAYTVIKDGCKSPSERVVPIMHNKEPDTLVDLRRFLAILIYYRIIMPLTVQYKAPHAELLPETRKDERRKVP
jgi:hypothetical protein